MVEIYNGKPYSHSNIILKNLTVKKPSTYHVNHVIKTYTPSSKLYGQPGPPDVMP